MDEGGGDIAAVGEPSPGALDRHAALEPDNVDPIHGALFLDALPHRPSIDATHPILTGPA
jgi:hypothetical protein